VRMGGIQPLLVLPLVYRMQHRDGPVWVGIAASLKLTPLAFALVYLMRRQWMRFAVAVAVAAALWAPVLLFDLSGYVTSVGDTILPVALWPVALVLALAGVIWSWRRPRFQAAATAVLTMVGSPKMHISYLSWLLAAPAGEPGARTFARRFARSIE
jgi:Glycosyltransferase family 87